MRGLVVDTSAWIDFFAGEEMPSLETALAQGAAVLPPLVVAELVSGARKPGEEAAIADLCRDLPIHDTPLEHWLRVGSLRRSMKDRGLTVSTPDAHVAQCALDREAPLLARDRILGRVAEASGLKVVRE